MNLPMKDVIRRLRRERDVTQEMLADALGVTFQSVSRWETGQAYPDMELIPKIAAYFNVSVDTLFGLDKSTVEAKRQAYLAEIEKYDKTYVWDAATEEARRDGDKFIAACHAMRTAFPNDELPMINLVRFYTQSRPAEIPAHMEELRGYCRKILEISSEQSWRTEALENLLLLAEDDEATKLIELLPTMYGCREAVLERRYDRLNDVEECNRQRQKNFHAWMRFLLYECVGKRDSNRYKNPEASAVGQRIALKLLDVVRDPSTDIDAWLNLRAFLTLRLAAAQFGAGNIDAGYEALERAVDLFVTLGELPPEKMLSYNCPLLDMLTVNKGQDEIYDYGMPGYYILYNAYLPLAQRSGWEWFCRVSGEERYKRQVRRLEPYLPAGNAVEL